MRVWPTKRIWKRLGLGLLLLVAIALIANAVGVWRTDAQWEKRIAALRAAGEPTSVAELKGPPIQDEKNAAVRFLRLEPRLSAFSHGEADFANSALGEDYENRAWRGEAPTAEQLDAIRSRLKAFSDLDAGLAGVAACDKYDSVSNYRPQGTFSMDVLSRQTQLIRGAGRYLNWKRLLLTAEGNYEEAVKQGLLLLQLARLYDHEPMMINVLVSDAVRGVAGAGISETLAAGPISPELHAALDRELSLFENSQRMVWTLKSERAYAIDSNPELADWGTATPAWLCRMFGWATSRRFEMLDVLETEIAAADETPQQKSARFDRYFATTKGKKTPTESMWVQVGMTYGEEGRTLVLLRSLRVLNALTAFRQEHGREAKGLAELKLPREATIDPYNRQPLKLKHVDAGWVVYSVMDNGTDDGGQFFDSSDFGVAPLKYRAEQEELADEERQKVTAAVQAAVERPADRK